MRLTIQMSDLGKALTGAEQAIESAGTSGMRDATTGLKGALRQDVVSARLGERLSRTWRGKTYPETGSSMEAAAFVWSKAPKLVDAFDRGVAIRSKNGLWLAIPTAAAGPRGAGANGRTQTSLRSLRNNLTAPRITPGGWERRTSMRLRFVYRRGRPSLLVADSVRINSNGRAAPNRRKSGQATAVIFLLVPQVSLRKRLDIDAAARAWTGRVPSLIARHWRTS